MNFKVPRGTQDILPSETWKWQQVEKIINETCDVYRYKEIRTPMFEQTELFQRTGRGDDRCRSKRNVYIYRSWKSFDDTYDLKELQLLSVHLSKIKCSAIRISQSNSTIRVRCSAMNVNKRVVIVNLYNLGLKRLVVMILQLMLK